jgi:hypothetical protein
VKQVVADELSVEEPIDTRLSERKKINIYGYLQNLKIIKANFKRAYRII